MIRLVQKALTWPILEPAAGLFLRPLPGSPSQPMKYEFGYGGAG